MEYFKRRCHIQINVCNLLFTRIITPVIMILNLCELRAVSRTQLYRLINY